MPVAFSPRQAPEVLETNASPKGCYETTMEEALTGVHIVKDVAPEIASTAPEVDPFAFVYDDAKLPC